MISTIQNTEKQVPELIKNDVDARLTKLRPMSTPVDQISRFTPPRSVNSMKVGYYAVAMRAFETVTARNINRVDLTDNPDKEFSIGVAAPSIFEVSETLMIDGITDENKLPIIFYVTAVDRNGTEISVRALNPFNEADSGKTYVPAIPASANVIRMGRAAGELDVQTGQYETLPKKKENYCQIFKTQIEQSTLMTRVNKEVGWTFSDQEEIAVYDMRLGMERSFLFGKKAIINDPVKKCEVYFTGGIWNQAGKEVAYTSKAMNVHEWIKIMAQAFTGHNGSKRKVLIAGTNLVERLILMTGSGKHSLLPETKVSRWGMDFTEMISKFGTLYVIHSEVLDSCGHADDGLIIDPDYLTKYVHTPFKAETLDLRSSGQRNTEAVVMTEISCLVLRHPDAHCRVVFKPETV